MRLLLFFQLQSILILLIYLFPPKNFPTIPIISSITFPSLLASRRLVTASIIPEAPASEPKFDDEDLILENFSSINRIIEIIKKRKLLNYKNYLNQKIKVKVDRKLGDKHPEYEYIYSLNYGYIPNTESEDGEEIDVYILGEFDPLEEFEGVCRAIIYRVDDIENKLIVTAEDKKYSIDQIKALVEFQERFFKTEIIMEK